VNRGSRTLVKYTNCYLYCFCYSRVRPLAQRDDSHGRRGARHTWRAVGLGQERDGVRVELSDAHVRPPPAPVVLAGRALASDDAGRHIRAGKQVGSSSSR
jgi:hypothetical protein